MPFESCATFWLPTWLCILFTYPLNRFVPHSLWCFSVSSGYSHECNRSATSRAASFLSSGVLQYAAKNPWPKRFGRIEFAQFSDTPSVKSGNFFFLLSSFESGLEGGGGVSGGGVPLPLGGTRLRLVLRFGSTLAEGGDSCGLCGRASRASCFRRGMLGGRPPIERSAVRGRHNGHLSGGIKSKVYLEFPNPSDSRTKFLMAARL